MKKNTFTIYEIKESIAHLRSLFDVVRLVDPTQTAIVTINDDNELVRTKYTCSGIWEKDGRCASCSSMLACIKKREVSKYEFKNEDTYHVVSKPITVTDFYNHRTPLVLEIVNHVPDDDLIHTLGVNNVKDMLKDSYKNNYYDFEMGTYNKRYFDEYIYVCHQSNLLPKDIALVAIECDGNKEEKKKLAAYLNQSVRTQDSVIYYGKNRFILILVSCPFEHAKEKLAKMSESVKEILDKNTHFAYGISHTNHFITNDLFVKQIYDRAVKSIENDKGELKDE